MPSVKRYVALVALAAACTAAGASFAAPSNPRSPTMHEFAFIFRPTRPVDPTDLPRRNAAAREWALARRSEGILRSGSPLENDGRVVTPDAVRALDGAHAVAAFLVLEATSLDAAVALAKTHPGLGYGTEIEVRPLKPVTLPPR